jgi:hypothetical protein
VDKCSCLDCNNYDNGVYLIRDWEIVGRKYNKGREQEGLDLKGFLHTVNEAQPADVRLDEWVINEYCDSLEPVSASRDVHGLVGEEDI